jgi:hypothetical protein
VKTKGWLLLAFIVILIGGGGVLSLKKVLLLQLENTDHPRTFQIRIGPSERFTVSCIHSIYNEPVIEEFEAEEGGIVLKGVRSKSPAVMEYFGFQDMKEFHPKNLTLGAIFLRVGMGKGQGLAVRDRTIYLSEIGARGERIRLGVKSVPLGYYWYLSTFKGV